MCFLSIYYLLMNIVGKCYEIIFEYTDMSFDIISIAMLCIHVVMIQLVMH